ncbi:MAG TPA: electron transport complex subunit RsxD [Gallionellaceae bacterium]|nr:electron transport complex subunit RsxD [Gallionellaceae bacterium]
MLSSPFISKPDSVSRIMLTVLMALIPGIALYVWSYGPAVLVSIALASVTALATEAAMLKLRKRPLKPFLSDNSALLTAWLLGVSVPALAPWWMVVVGTAFAIAVAKHLYGGLGSNPFNPAMVGYAALIISFPVQMTHWIAPHGVGGHVLSFSDQLGFIFGNHLPDGLTLDAVTTATPLDTLKTQLHMNRHIADIFAMPIYGDIAGKGSELVALGFLIGGAWLLFRRIITWHIPVAFLGALFVTAGIYHLYDPAHYVAPPFHLVAGASMLGAFFILTDPITGPTTPKGKLIFAGGAGVLTYMIRVFGGFPDGIAFATLLMNICAPLIDAYTQPKVFGTRGAGK